MTIGIYEIKNLINKKIYIGKATNIEKRFRQHLLALIGNRHRNKHLQWAFNKYKENNFSFSILETCLKEELIKKEKQYIKMLKTKNRKYGYNLTDGGEGVLGHRHNKKTRELMSEKKRGKNHPRYGKSFSHTKETKIKIGDSQRGEKSPLYGIPKSEEWKTMMSERMSGSGNPNYRKTPSDETIRKRSESMIGENHWNFGKKSPKASSKYYGIAIIIAKKKYIYWQAHVRENGKRYHIGTYKTEIEAALAYDKHVRKYNLSNPLNFP